MPILIITKDDFDQWELHSEDREIIISLSEETYDPNTYELALYNILRGLNKLSDDGIQFLICQAYEARAEEFRKITAREIIDKLKEDYGIYL